MTWYDPRSWDWIQRAFMARVDTPDHGADSAPDHPRNHGFDQLHSMAAMARFAYVYAAATRRAADMASLPIKLYAGNPDRDPDATEIPDHPLLDLLDRPNTEDTGEELRRQCAVDLMLPGNSYLLKVGAATDAPPLSLLRYHPDEVRIVPQRHGRRIKCYELGVGEAAQLVDPDLVLHTRGPSWRPGAQGLYGQGNIEALSDELTTKLKAREHQMKLAGQGRPDVVLSPADDGDTWTSKDRDSIKEAWAKMSKGGGPLIMGGSAKADFLNLTPREMEYTQLDDRIISAIMASMQTPPIVLGRPTANYATARQQDAVYWRGIAHDARLFDARWTVGLARLYGEVGGKRLHLRHDFSAVLPLQGERTAQVDRAHKHILAGATPAEAYTYEGLAGAPVPDEVHDLAPPAPAAEDADNAPPEAEAPDEVQGADTPTDDDGTPLDNDDRADRGLVAALRQAPQRRTSWQRWLVKVHKPAERRLKRATVAYLRAARARYIERLKRAVAESGSIQLALVGDGVDWQARGISIEAIIDMADESDEAIKALSPAWKRSWLVAATAAASELPITDLTFDPHTPEVVNLIKSFTDSITETQAITVRTIVEEGLASGAGIGTMQEQLALIETGIADSRLFTAARARMIARTEATRAVNLGTINAYQEVAALGLTVEKIWRTAEDGERHPSYPGLHGQVRALDADFDLNGVPSPFPGGSGEASEDINCRCTTSSKVTGGDPLF